MLRNKNDTVYARYILRCFFITVLIQTGQVNAFSEHGDISNVAKAPQASLLQTYMKQVLQSVDQLADDETNTDTSYDFVQQLNVVLEQSFHLPQAAPWNVSQECRDSTSLVLQGLISGEQWALKSKYAL